MSKVLYINTFNGFSLQRSESEGGRELPRRLAALAVLLAHHGDSGISRERVLDLLWAEHDPSRSRHALNQSIYALRRSLGHDEVIVGTTQLSFDATAIGSDVADFADAERRDDARKAVSLYRGPFLDGFFVSGAAEFERWVSLRREEYAHRVSHLLERLAAEAETAGELTDAAGFWRQRAAIDPLDASVVLSLMRVLAAGGNAAAAIQQGRVYQQMVEQEPDLRADQRIADFSRELASGRWVAPIPAEFPATGRTGAPRANHAIGVVEKGAEEGSLATLAAPGEVERAPTRPTPIGPVAAYVRERASVRSLFAGGIWVWVVVAFGVIALTVVALTTAREGWTVRAAAFGAAPKASLVVLPFRASGAEGTLAYLRDGMVDLLTDILDEDEGVSLVDPARVHAAWRTIRESRREGGGGGGGGGGAGGTGGRPLPTDSMLRIASALGAQRAVVGALVGSPSRLLINASMFETGSGRRVAQAMTYGPVDSLPLLARQLVVRLLAQAAGEREVAERNPTLDVAALRAYLAGRAAQREGEWRAALQAFSSAERLDSTLGAASLGVAVAADWLGEETTSARALARTFVNRHDLSPGERAELEAVAGARYPAPAFALEQLAAWEHAAALAPDRTEHWIELARRLIHDGPAAGLPRARERAERALERALALDPSHRQAQVGRLLLARARGDGDATRRALGALRRSEPGTLLGPAEEWSSAAVLGDEATLARWRPALDTLADDALRAIARSALADGAAVADGRRAARARAARTTSGSARLDALVAAHAYARATGHPDEADEALGELAEEGRALGAHLRLRVLDGLYGEGDSTAAATAARTLAARTARPLPEGAEPRAVQLADLCVLEQWKLRIGDGSSVGRSARLLGDQTEPPLFPAPAIAAPAPCALLLTALAEGGTAGTGAVARLDSIALTTSTVGDLRHYAPLVLARLHVARGEEALALAAVRRRAYDRGWPRYVAPTLQLESEIAERVGDRDGARWALRRLVALREGAARELTPALELARARLAALAQE